MSAAVTTSRLGSSGPAQTVRTLSEWVQQFGGALAARDKDATAALFHEACTVRDLLALSWDFRNAVGVGAAVDLLCGQQSTAPLQLGISPDSSPVVEPASAAAFLEFKTRDGAGEGFLQISPDADGVWRADTLILSMTGLDSHPEQVDAHRPVGRAHGPVPGRLGWNEQQDKEFTDRDPTVVILGAGHNGLMVAARLRALGIPALIVEKNARVGDNWRKRYSSLALHTPVVADQLPYLPYPATWTRFTPKDKLADFFESYSVLLDLAVWTRSEAQDVHFDDETGRWNLDVVRADGTVRHLTPDHLVFATGMNGAPRRPSFPGQDNFVGTVIHAVDYNGWRSWAGKRVVVVGSGVSGHDIAQDLAEHDIDVTMIQRSGTVVLNTSTFHKVMHATHTGGRYTLAEGDLINAAIPFGHLPTYGAAQLAEANEMDREMLDGLTAAGFELSEGPNGQGVLGLIFGLNATGYYYNAGASELIADGTIKLRHGDVRGFNDEGVALADGTTVPADLVVFATGYEPPTAIVRDVLGDDIANQLGEFAHVSPDGEYGRLWRHSGIDRLWLMISLSIEHGRFYSRLVALQIAAIEAGTRSASGAAAAVA